MNIFTGPETGTPIPKSPRKPRPSELAAKKAKAAKKKKPPAKRSKSKTKRAKPAKGKHKAPGPGVIRTERADLRLTKQEKAKIMTRARKMKQTVTAVVMEAIHKVKW
jgi:hypothetical protein